MKLARLVYEAPPGRILLAVLAILFALAIGPAYSASEPGTVTIVVATEPENLDPNNNTRVIEGQVIMRNVVETLTEMSLADGSMMPRLAHSWKQIDPNTYHFFLRKGVKFHDGADFNAEAVIFSIKRLYEKKLVSTTRAQSFAGFTMEGKALDSHTLEVKTDKPQPLLPLLMGILPICSPNTPPDKPVRNPIGTGPYKFVRWDAGTQIITERFDGYWGKQPEVKKAVYIWRAESAVRASMVLIGEADLAPNISKQDATRPDMDYSYLNSETTQLRLGAWEPPSGMWDPPLNDRRVRLAFNYATDRNAIRGSVFSKDVVPATQLIGPNIFGHNPDLKVWPYDPKKARQLLDEARKDGVPVDREIFLVGRIAEYPGSDELAEVLLTMYRAVGLNVKIKMIERAVARTYANKPYVKNVGPYVVSKSHDNNKGDAAFTIPYGYTCDGVTSTICDKKIDDLIAKAQVATGEERRALWQGVIKVIHEEIVPDVMLFHMVGYCRVGKRINYKPSLQTNNEIQLAGITFK